MSIETLAARIEWAGGDTLGRINKQKLYSLRSALKSSYNARQIKTPDKGVWMGLMNISNQKSDYDKKILSIEFDSGLQTGDTFEMLNDHTHWMVYLQQLTETAYLKAEIIECRYTLDIDGHEYWIYFQGPTETDLSWFKKDNINYNKPNLSGTVYIKKDERTTDYFSRFSKIKLDGNTWEVQVVDRITVPGIIELEIQEYYNNPIAEIPYIQKKDTIAQILGETLVKQDTIQGYKIDKDLYNPDFHWEVEGNDRVKVLEELEGGRYCKVKVHPGAIRKYRVKYTNGNTGYHLDVHIDIEQPFIQGDQEVRPFDIKQYRCEEPGTFWVQTKAAQVSLDETNRYRCELEILKAKKGEFKLFFKSDITGETHTLPIKILSA